MFKSLSSLLDAEVHTSTGSFGFTADFVTDDHLTELRYLQIRPRKRHSGTGIFVPINAVAEPGDGLTYLDLGLSDAELESLAGIDLLTQHSRELERRLHDLIHWRPYWQRRPGGETTGLRSLKRALTMTVTCPDGPAGALDDVLAETDDWSTPLMTVRRDHQAGGGLSLISTASIESISWRRETISLASPLSDLDGAAIDEPPETLSTSDVEKILEDLLPLSIPGNERHGRHG